LYSKVSEAKFSTAKKEYTCLTCCNVISKDSKYVTCNHFSKELAEAWEELTKYRPWAKKFECFVSLKFCSGRCYRAWERAHKENYKDAKDLHKRYIDLVITARDRRTKNWKDWVIWKEIFTPLDDRWRINT